jgi:hypothetical protein
VVARLDGEIDVTYVRNGGVLHTVLRRLASVPLPPGDASG